MSPSSELNQLSALESKGEKTPFFGIFIPY